MLIENALSVTLAMVAVVVTGAIAYRAGQKSRPHTISSTSDPVAVGRDIEALAGRISAAHQRHDQLRNRRDEQTKAGNAVEAKEAEVALTHHKPEFRRCAAEVEAKFELLGDFGIGTPKWDLAILSLLVQTARYFEEIAPSLKMGALDRARAKAKAFIVAKAAGPPKEGSDGS